MIQFSAENKNALTPAFVTGCLEGITHRFLLVLECETRMANDERGIPRPAPPRFAIGGARATIDPRNAKVKELMPFAKYKLELPEGWVSHSRFSITQRITLTIFLFFRKKSTNIYTFCSTPRMSTDGNIARIGRMEC